MKRFQRVERGDTRYDELSGEYFYSSMPDDVEWYASRCSPTELGGFYHRCGEYAALSGNTGRVAESARIAARDHYENPDATEQTNRIRAIVEQFDERKLGPLLLGTNDLANGPYNVIDGNCRAVALEILSQYEGTAIQSIPVFIALSRATKIRSWETP